MFVKSILTMSEQNYLDADVIVTWQKNSMSFLGAKCKMTEKQYN